MLNIEYRWTFSRIQKYVSPCGIFDTSPTLGCILLSVDLSKQIWHFCGKQNLLAEVKCLLYTCPLMLLECISWIIFFIKDRSICLSNSMYILNSFLSRVTDLFFKNWISIYSFLKSLGHVCCTSAVFFFQNYMMTASSYMYYEDFFINIIIQWGGGASKFHLSSSNY